MRIFGTVLLLWIYQLAVGQNNPNIIIYLSDDHGAEDARCFGNPDLHTPVIDQLAGEGMVFTRAYTPVSVCAPSRSVLFTGLYPHRNGCDRNHSGINTDIKTLPFYLKALGYKVVLAGKKHIKPENKFDFKYIELWEVPDFLKNADDSRFCLIISSRAPHQPYFNQKGGYGKITSKSWMPDTEETRKYTAAYYDHINILDHELGTYLYWVEKYGFSDALQIYTSDHGPAFPFAKWTLYDQGIRVPFIVKWPGVIRPGTRNKALVSFVDFLPSLIEIAGGTIPENLDGESITPLLFRQRDTIHSHLYAAYTNLGVKDANEYPIRAVITDEWKLIVNLKYENEFHIKRMDTSDERAVIDSYDVLRSWMKDEDLSDNDRQRGIQHWSRPVAELYNLHKDPNELDNLASINKYKTVKMKMLDQLIEWMELQGDPLTADAKEIYMDLKSKNK